MNENKLLKNNELILKTKSLVTEERRITLAFIACLEEISRRLLYAEMGYGSLFDFCTRHLGLSEGSAHRRISAMRLARDVPNVKEKLHSGDLSLSNAAKIEVTLRHAKKSSLSHQKEKIITECLNLSQKECELKLFTLVPESKNSIHFTEKTRPLDETHHELKLVITTELKNKINQLQNFISHQNHEKSLVKLLEKLVDQELAKQIQKRTPRDVQKNDETPTQAAPAQIKYNLSNSAAESSTISHPNNARKHIPAPIQKQIWARAKNQCQFENCTSRYQLQIEHKQPVACGGGNQIENLELLCRAHNLLRAKQVFGEAVFQHYAAHT